MRVLTWNLFHGRAVPGAACDLMDEFASVLASWDWDVALLQEVPPWWPPTLARACGADTHTALTSRNAVLPLRRALAMRHPDLMRSNGGSANAILVRGARITDHRRLTLRYWPERRVCHAVAVENGPWCANLHAQVRSEARAQADTMRAAAAALAWALGGPVLLGGDFNVRKPVASGFAILGGHGVDHVLGRRMRPAGPVELPDRGRFSDHAAVIVSCHAAPEAEPSS